MTKNNNLFAGLSAEELRKRKKTEQPSFVPLMLATLTVDYFSRKDWVYEHKFDGERCLATKKKGKVVIFSRNHRIINGEYPELVEALKKDKADNFIIDGEIVATGQSGISDFELLQSRINLKDTARLEKKLAPIAYCIFDIIYADGYDLRNMHLLARKSVLKKLIRYNKMLLYTEHKVGNGIEFFKYACKHKWEGLIAKYAESSYIGKRSKSWLKFKCIMKQELVIGGYTDPEGSRSDFGALLVGYYDHGKLKFAGKVGSGYSHDTLKLLGKKMRALEIKKSPFSNYDESTLRVHWIKPLLVAEFEFAQWTRAGKLRVPRYKGLRIDKPAKDVVKEIPKAIGPIK